MRSPGLSQPFAVRRYWSLCPSCLALQLMPINSNPFGGEYDFIVTDLTLSSTFLASEVWAGCWRGRDGSWAEERRWNDRMFSHAFEFPRGLDAPLELWHRAYGSCFGKACQQLYKYVIFPSFSQGAEDITDCYRTTTTTTTTHVEAAAHKVLHSFLQSDAFQTCASTYVTLQWPISFTET